ncbi:MAG: BamA/TamA family outer membrane protein [Chitinophagaceae bacterium]|nr:BamA/TamA family outer membrane protein [Chitinophagaceae bacterium]
MFAIITIKSLSKNTFVAFYFFIIIIVPVFLLTNTAAAQNNYPLIINLVDKDTSIDISSSLNKLQALGLQTSFNNLALCSAYIYDLPATLHFKGYPAASVDFVQFDSVAAHINLYLGQHYKWVEVNTDSVEKNILEESGWNEKHMRNKKPDLNEIYIGQQRILKYYENIGYPFAQIKLDSIQIEEDRIRSNLKVNKGIVYRIDSLRIYGKAKIKNLFLQRYLGIKNGSLYNNEKLQNVSKRLLELPYVQEQQPSDLTMLGTGATLNLYLKPKRSSQVNFLVGFLPGNGIAEKPQLTGDINLDLKNTLGSGESILFNWQQLQKRSPRLNLGFQHPYIFNSPFGIDFTFNLLKRDSGYLQLNSQLGLQYILSANQSGKIFIQNQRTYLLQGGYDTNQIRISKKLPPNIDVTANSIGIDYEWINTNYKFNPRNGNEVRFVTTIGLKNISKNNDISNLKDPADPGFNFNSLYDSLKLKTYQVRLTLIAAHYFPAGKKSTFKAGISGGVFQSQAIFRNELFQIGGYRLLRGFNEESIYATQYAVITAEYRLLVGINSYLSGFTDVGFTKTRFQTTNFTNRYTGAGLGLTFETKFGLLNLSYALGKQSDVKFDISNSSKIHFGYINYF